MITPEAVVFDLGKVLVDFDYHVATRRMAARVDLTDEELYRWFATSPLLLRYESGELNREDFFRDIRAATGFRGDLAEFGQYFADIFTPIEPMVALHAQLRARSIPTYVFSNTNDLAVAHIRANFPFFAGFDGYVYSFEHHAMKPDRKLYEVVERVSRRQGAQLLYLDDRAENIETGAQRGWQVIHHQDPATTRALVQKLGLL
jgi:glucose-1-phosphatase